VKKGGKTMILTVIGSCANQISNREGVSLFVENGYDNLLIDCGPGIVAAFGRCCRRTSEVKNLLLTHVHGDHIAGFPYFVWNRNFECMGSTPPEDLHVYGERETVSLAKHMLEHCYPELAFPFKVIYHEIKAGDTFSSGTLNIETICANHAVPCVSCVINCGGKKLVYTSDTLYNEILIDKAEYADVLVHEGMMPKSMEPLANKVKHSTAFMAGKFAYDVKAKQMLMVHIAPSLLGKESILIEEAASNYQGPISIPCDGSVYMV